VYADAQHPITESAPRLTEVVSDPAFLEKEDYAVPKSKCEDFLRSSCLGEPWTIVRPVISFSQKRLDLLMASGRQVLELAARKEILYLPKLAKDFIAGLDWAGNSGKLIANLLFREETIGDTFTIYSGHKLTWCQVAEIYQKLIGLQVCWCDEEEFLAQNPEIRESKWWTWVFDRRFNRDIDCSKVMKATGLTPQDFSSVEQGIITELNIISNTQTTV
jgi:nucleoside-diphosphate-sugar epimerase